jgi:hypothetical protein
LDTKRNVFDGFTPVKWESDREGKWKPQEVVGEER